MRKILFLTVCLTVMLGGIVLWRQVAQGNEGDLWGPPMRNGLHLSVKPAQESFAIGDAIRITLRLKNTAGVAAYVYHSDLSNFRPVLYDANGAAIPMTVEGQKAANMFGAPRTLSANMQIIIPSQQEIDDATIDLQQWYNITTPGTYRLIVLREVPAGNNRSYVISNLVSLTIK